MFVHIHSVHVQIHILYVFSLCVNSLILFFFQVIAGAKSDLHYDVFEEESQQRTKKCKLSIEDTNDCDVGLSVSFGSPTESYQVSFSLQYTIISYEHQLYDKMIN